MRLFFSYFVLSIFFIFKLIEAGEISLNDAHASHGSDDHLKQPANELSGEVTSPNPSDIKVSIANGQGTGDSKNWLIANIGKALTSLTKWLPSKKTPLLESLRQKSKNLFKNDGDKSGEKTTKSANPKSFHLSKIISSIIPHAWMSKLKKIKPRKDVKENLSKIISSIIPPPWMSKLKKIKARKDVKEQLEDVDEKIIVVDAKKRLMAAYHRTKHTNRKLDDGNDESQHTNRKLDDGYDEILKMDAAVPSRNLLSQRSPNTDTRKGKNQLMSPPEYEKESISTVGLLLCAVVPLIMLAALCKMFGWVKCSRKGKASLHRGNLLCCNQYRLPCHFSFSLPFRLCAEKHAANIFRNPSIADSNKVESRVHYIMDKPCDHTVEKASSPSEIQNEKQLKRQNLNLLENVIGDSWAPKIDQTCQMNDIFLTDASQVVDSNSHELYVPSNTTIDKENECINQHLGTHKAIKGVNGTGDEFHEIKDEQNINSDKTMLEYEMSIGDHMYDTDYTEDLVQQPNSRLQLLVNTSKESLLPEENHGQIVSENLTVKDCANDHCFVEMLNLDDGAGDISYIDSPRINHCENNAAHLESPENSHYEMSNNNTIELESPRNSGCDSVTIKEQNSPRITHSEKNATELQSPRHEYCGMNKTALEVLMYSESQSLMELSRPNFEPTNEHSQAFDYADSADGIDKCNYQMEDLNERCMQNRLELQFENNSIAKDNHEAPEIDGGKLKALESTSTQIEIENGDNHHSPTAVQIKDQSSTTTDVNILTKQGRSVQNVAEQTPSFSSAANYRPLPAAKKSSKFISSADREKAINLQVFQPNENELSPKKKKSRSKSKAENIAQCKNNESLEEQSPGKKKGVMKSLKSAGSKLLGGVFKKN